ncbi:MAG: hypothetical protein JO353_13070 [Phycisphaerae bacterium]|nr:hypothetical protein [Phycisphaerae bacterium]
MLETYIPAVIETPPLRLGPDNPIGRSEFIAMQRAGGRTLEHASRIADLAEKFPVQFDGASYFVPVATAPPSAKRGQNPLQFTAGRSRRFQ